MFTFAIGAAATIALSLMAQSEWLREPLHRFVQFAGVFVQVMGLIETLRRVNSGVALTITPGIPGAGIPGVPNLASARPAVAGAVPVF